MTHTLSLLDLVGSKARINDCEDIHVTEPQHVNGRWVREIRFYGKNEAGNVGLVVTVQVTNEEKSKLEVTPPPIVIR